MKFYILTGEPFPQGMAATNRIICYAKSLLIEKVDCEVIIFRRTEVYGKVANNYLGEGIFDGITFTYIGGTPLRGSNVLIRQFNDYFDKRETKRFLKNNLNKGDVIFFYAGSEIDFAEKVICIAHSKGATVVKDLGELPFGTVRENRKSIRNRQRMLSKVFPILDGFIPISDSLFDLAKNNASKTATILKVPIMVDFSKYELPDRSDEVEIPYIFHSGTLSEQKDGILGMIEAFGMASKMMSMPIKFISTGFMNSSPHSKEIADLIKTYDLQDKLVFTGYLSHDELREYLSKASLTIINKYATQQNRYCFSTKLGEYLAAGKPVIMTRVGEAVNYLKDGETAFFVEPGDVAQLSEKIRFVLTHREIAIKVGKNGKNLCKEVFDYRVYGNKLVQSFVDEQFLG